MKVNVPELNLPRVVIIGGGFGGISLAKSLKNAPVQVVMFDQHNYHTFQPLLYQVATGGLEADSIAFPLRKMFKRQKNFFFRMARVLRVNTQKREVCTSIGEISYDYLVVATGSKTNYFGNQKLENAAHSMKNIPESLDLRHLILQNFEKALLTSNLEEREALMNIVVVGAGPTGAETAGALAELKRHILPKDYPELDIRKMQIHLVEAADKVLPGMSPRSSENAQRSLEKLGVTIWLNNRVEGVEGDNINTSSGKVLLGRTVIWSAGVLGNMLEGLEAAATKGARLKVDQYNKVIGLDRVFAIGDIAQMESQEFPWGHPMVAQPAIQQGRLLAKNLRKGLRDQRMTPFKYRDKGSMATIGRNKAVVDLGKLHFRGLSAWFMWMAVHLYFLAGFRNRLIVFTNWFISYVTYDKGTRLIIRPFRGKGSAAPTVSAAPLEAGSNQDAGQETNSKETVPGMPQALPATPTS